MYKGILFFVIIWSVLATTGSSSAWAQQADSSASEIQKGSLAEAKEAQVKAAQLFRDNRFEEAAALLQFAYRYDPRPILLFNAGQAYRKAERAQEAKSLYEQFLAAAPEHPLAAETRGYLKDMEALLAMQLRAKAVALALEEQLAAKQAGDSEAARVLEAERQRNLQIKQTLLQTQAQLEVDRQKLRSRRRWILGLSIGLPVGVTAIVGIAAGLYIKSRVSTDGGTALIQN
jgi:tetratricopeptide (TPR) repeat protein